MKTKLGDYFIETDERQYKVKKYVGKDKDGNDVYKTIAYCTQLSETLKFIPQQVVRSNDDISIIIDKLKEIEQEINDMYDYLKMGTEYLKENNNYKDRYEELKDYISKNYESEGV